MTWVQISLQVTREHVEFFEDLLLAVGAVSVTLLDTHDTPVLEPGVGETPLWQDTTVMGLFEANAEIELILAAMENTFEGEFPQHKVEILEDKDWERAWIDNYKPMAFGERLWICPNWIAPPVPEAVNLMLDPGLAFGTGTHPTTDLCLKWLDGHQWDGNEHVLDFGCGSGILAIAALLLGAKDSVGVDIDPQAVTATRNNADKNNISPERIAVYLPEDAPSTLADVTVANILAGPLMQLAPQLIDNTKVGGHIVLSGVLEEQAKAVAEAYVSNVDWQPLAVKDGWARLSGIRIK